MAPRRVIKLCDTLLTVTREGVTPSVINAEEPTLCVIGFDNGTAHVETSSGYTRRFESLAEALEYAQPLVVGDPK